MTPAERGYRPRPEHLPPPTKSQAARSAEKAPDWANAPSDHEGFLVDKTGFIRQLIAEGSQYFLSRPRRFGKSLLLDTIVEVFVGNEPLFRGLEIHPHWDCSVRFPVIRFSFAEGVLHSRVALDARIDDLLRLNAEALDLTLHPGLDVAGTFGDLIRQAQARHGQRVVVLVDEYDKPILDNSRPARRPFWSIC